MSAVHLSSWMSTYLPLLSTVVVAAATVILVLLTSKYVKLTGKLVGEAQRSREPAVTIDFEVPDGLLRLAVANRGWSPARDVRISVLKDVSWLQTGPASSGFATLSPVKEGISYLAPSRTLKYRVGRPQWKGVQPEDMQAMFRLTYAGQGGVPHEETVTFDFTQLRDVLFESFRDPTLSVAEAIRSTERDRHSHQRARNMFEFWNRRKMKACPMCAQMIPQEARKCSHCGELLEK